MVKTKDGYYVYEAYFDAKNKLRGTTKTPCEPYGETLKELRRDLKWFTEALNKPVINERAVKRMVHRKV